MHRIDSQGATAENLFTEGDPAAAIPPTIVSSAWLNDVQEELVTPILRAGKTLVKGSQGQLLDALFDLIMPVGSIQWLADYAAPSAANPRFSLASADQVLSAANWPDLVAYLRARKLTYNNGIAGQKSAFDVASWARAANVVTLTLAETTAENKILAALAEDQAVHGSYTGWRTVTVPALGVGAAGTYAITEINATARTIKFAQTAADETGTTTTCEFYTNRLSSADDPTGVQARHFSIQGRALVSVNDTDGEVIAGLRRRDRMQGHYHSANLMDASTGAEEWGAGADTGASWMANKVQVLGPSTDGTNGTPRTGKTTDPRALGAVPYIWGKTYIA